MKIAIRTKTITDLLEVRKIEWEEGKQAIKWSSPNDRQTFEIEDIPDNVMLELRQMLDSGKTETDRTARLILQNYDALNLDHTSEVVTRLEQLVSAFKNFFEDAPNKWVFLSEATDSRLLPMYVHQITYHPDEWEVKGKKRKLIEEASVTMDVSYINRRERLSKRFRWTRADINREDGTRLALLLRKHNLSKETRPAMARYAEEIKRFQEISEQTGAQFAAVGMARITSGTTWYRQKTELQPMVREGRPTKVVMDDEADEGAVKRHEGNPRGCNPTTSMDFWHKVKKTARDVTDEDDLDELYDDGDDAPTTTLPTWPFVKVFDLKLHQHCEMHVNDVEDYPWDEGVFDKLILPKDHKSLIEILVNGTNNLMEDIIAGKTGGIIILATGKPGVGKTLTAEVYSEFIQRPVYSVQCSQLGLNVDSIEKNLTQVLERAQRWNALLLLDEADVYIRHRGHDLHHNAIVGVFLRILEYYRGVLFMTSNRATIIDDAVLSRVTAHIRYEVPDESMRRELWQVLGNQYNVKFDKKTLDTLAKEFQVAGRDIKSMLKLATLMRSSKGDEVSLDLLRTVLQFQDTADSMSARGINAPHVGYIPENDDDED